MRVRRCRFVMLGIVCGIALGAGCKTKKPRVSTHDLLMPEILEGDIALSERFENGVRITDVQFESALFAYDSFQIDNSEVGKIERVAEYMRDNRNVRLVSEGHCDERGSREYNMSLGEHRALAVRAYLVGMGIDGARIQSRSYGEEAPSDAGHSESAWRRNRRVEFALYR